MTSPNVVGGREPRTARSPGTRRLPGAGRLAGWPVGRGQVAPAAAGLAAATLTAAGLSALVYGVLDPGDIVIRGLGDIPADPAARLRTLFPRAVPYLYARF